jgi:uncharacterized protein (TIGR00297 family)
MWIGYIGFRRRSLSESGVVGAVLVGTTIFGFGGWAWGTLLVVFFVSSSALSHFKESLKASLAEKFSKGHERDLAQALANGGAGALVAVANAIWPHPIWWAAFVGAMATVNADTWATELGVLSKARPRLVTNGRPVEVGTSGAITLRGTFAAVAGAALISILPGVLAGQAEAAKTIEWLRKLPQTIDCPPFIPGCTPEYHFWTMFFAVLFAGTLVGLLGSLFDSFLGATVQAIYFCDHCRKETERHPTHICGNPARRVRGWRWLDNDWVNFISSVVGAAVAAGLWLWLA